MPSLTRLSLVNICMFHSYVVVKLIVVDRFIVTESTGIIANFLVDGPFVRLRALEPPVANVAFFFLVLVHGLGVLPHIA